MEKAQKRQAGRPSKSDPNMADVILNAAKIEFSDLGFKGATIRSIAKRAGVSHALIVHHFTSKKGLWEFVIDDARESLIPYLENIQTLERSKDIPIKERIKKVFSIAIGAVNEYISGGYFVFQSKNKKEDPDDVWLQKLLRPFHDSIIPILKDAMAENIIPEQDVEMLFFAIFNTVLYSVPNIYMIDYFDDSIKHRSNLQEDLVKLLMINFIHD